MRSVVMIMRTAAAVLVGPAAAQTPSFAGRWVLAPEPPSRTQSGGRLTPSAPGTLWGSDVTLAQDATTLTVEYARFARSDMQPPTKLVYRLDGSESRNTVNIGRGPQEQVSRAKWDGDRLIITTLHRFTTSAAGVTPARHQRAPDDRATSARPQDAQDSAGPAGNDQRDDAGALARVAGVAGDRNHVERRDGRALVDGEERVQEDLNCCSRIMPPVI